jgi:hypothetical protein
MDDKTLDKQNPSLHTSSQSMTIKDLGTRIESVWEGLRPMTKKMIERALQEASGKILPPPRNQFAYDMQSDWELSRLLTALDEQMTDPNYNSDPEKLREMDQLADACYALLEDGTGAAEAFIQLADRTLKRGDFARFDKLSNILGERFSAGEIAEIIRQNPLPQIKAVAYETLAMLPPMAIVNLFDDPLYEMIAHATLEKQAFEFGNSEARMLLDNIF